jgi:hypothetical protein
VANEPVREEKLFDRVRGLFVGVPIDDVTAGNGDDLEPVTERGNVLGELLLTH